MEFDASKDVITNEMLNDLISNHATRATKMKQMYDAYKGKTPILKREFQDPTKLNNKLVNDYRGDIVDTINGYLYGHPISRQLDKNKYDEVSYESVTGALEDFLIRNSVDNIDAEVGKMASICGYGVKLLYINNDGEEAVTSIKPWECVFVDDGSLHAPQVAIRYYTITGKDEVITKVELYDNTFIRFYEKEGNEDFRFMGEQPHMFGAIPLIKYKNNEEELGDFEKVETLIDAYEKVVSDVQNEAEEMRLAYMLFYGVDVSTETLLKARQTGGFILQDGEKIEFLTKDINIDFIEKHKETINENIYKFAKVPDMSDENFAGNASGVALKFKLLGLENKAITKERKFNAAERQLYKALQAPWNAKGIPMRYLDIFNTFKRNIPVDIAAEVELATKLKGIVSNRTLLAGLSMVDDVDYELELLEKEQSGQSALLNDNQVEE